MPEVTLFSMTQLDWTRLAEILNRILGRSPLRGVDTRENNRNPAAMLKLFESVASLYPIKGGPSTHRFAMWEALSFGFLVAASDKCLYEFATMFQGSKILAAEGTLVLYTGNLLQWHTFLVGANGTSHTLSPEFRQVAGQIFDLFASIGLREVWSEYTKRDQGNGIFLLEQR